jgi:hypothetical protein
MPKAQKDGKMMGQRNSCAKTGLGTAFASLESYPNSNAV